MNKISTAIAIVFLLAVSIFYLMPSHPEPGAGRHADDLCKKLLAEKENREALNWIEESKPGNTRTLGEQDPQESLRIIKEIYSAGAVKASVIEIEKEPGYGETTNTVCFEIPITPALRKNLFKIESKIASTQGFDPAPDEGQTYLFLYKFKLSAWQSIKILFHHDK